MQVVLVYLQPFRRNSVLKCALHPKIAKKFTKNRFLRGSRSFKVIDVDKFKKPVTSTCYNEQHVCTYLQPFLHYSSQYRQKWRLFRGYPYLTLSFERNPCTQWHEILSR